MLERFILRRLCSQGKISCVVKAVGAFPGCQDQGSERVLLWGLSKTEPSKSLPNPTTTYPCLNTFEAALPIENPEKNKNMNENDRIQESWKQPWTFRAKQTLVGFAGVLSLCAAQAQTVSLLTDHYTYLVGEDIIAGFQAGPGNPLDWIGFYNPGDEPGAIPSTRWLYVGGTQGGTAGLTEGTITFTGGLGIPGDYVSYFFLNDGYTKLATNLLRVVDPSQTFVRTSQRVYQLGQTISVPFTNGPGNAKDWIGIYPEDRLPGNGSSLVWAYVDGTQSSSIGKTEGVIDFAGGLTTLGKYVAYLLENDGYNVLASEPFEIRPATTGPRILTIRPVDGATNIAPNIGFVATITNGSSQVVPSTILLSIDGKAVVHRYTQQNGLTTVSFTSPSLLAAASVHSYRLTFSDNALAVHSVTNDATFTIAPYVNVQLPTPLYLEDFDTTVEGKLPPGWTSVSYSDVTEDAFDLQDLNSKSYADWVVVDRSRFTNAFLSYDTHNSTTDYQRVLSINPLNVENGQFVSDLAQGQFVFGDSGYRSGGNQYLILFTPDFDLTGKTNIYLSYHSLWEQNQDCIGSVEYSIDQAATWLPIVYLLDGRDVLTNETGAVDAVVTFSTEYPDLAIHTDPITGEQKGGTYSAYIGAAVSDALAPYISSRLDDDPFESKRIELFRLPMADNQSKVRFRIAYAGTDSWYFGIDHFGLYSMGTSSEPNQPNLTIALSGNEVIISWPPTATGYTLQSTSSLSAPNWLPVSGASGSSVRVPLVSGQAFYRLKK